MSVFHCRCVSCAVRLGTGSTKLPDDGPVGPKHVGVILKLILICVEGFKV
jgi:hypothetical protein